MDFSFCSSVSLPFTAILYYRALSTTRPARFLGLGRLHVLSTQRFLFPKGHRPSVAFKFYRFGALRHPTLFPVFLEPIYVVSVFFKPSQFEDWLFKFFHNPFLHFWSCLLEVAARLFEVSGTYASLRRPLAFSPFVFGRLLLCYTVASRIFRGSCLLPYGSDLSPINFSLFPSRLLTRLFFSGFTPLGPVCSHLLSNAQVDNTCLFPFPVDTCKFPPTFSPGVPRTPVCLFSLSLFPLA